MRLLRCRNLLYLNVLDIQFHKLSFELYIDLACSGQALNMRVDTC